MIQLKKIILISILILGLEGAYAKKIIIKKEDLYKNSIVKIFTVATESDPAAPWSSEISKFSGSGCIIDGNKILTNAHVVTNGTYIEVLKNGEVKRYEAKVLSIDYETDLALITVKDKTFFKNTKSLEFGELPELQEEVTVYGYPMGGESLSITKGVVSRIEHQEYVQSGKNLLSIQIDAAINYGNSGGPALSDGKIVGIVMQELGYGDNIGYIIPTTVIKHYFKDMEDKHYDGYPFWGVMIQNLESPVMKDMYGLKDKGYGVLVNKTTPNSPASRVLKTGDILIALDGHKIFSNAKIELRDKLYVEYTHILDQHQMNDELNLTILRNGEELNLTTRLDKKSDELLFVKTQKPDVKPTYYIYGGLVFVPSVNLYSLSSKYYENYPDENRTELVLLSQILSSSLTQGINDTMLDVIETVNGKRFKDFKSFVKLVEESKEKFLVFEDADHTQVVLNREEVLKNQKSILKRYDISYAKSKDLRE